MRNEDLVADQEAALLLKETGLMEGVEADGYHQEYRSREGKLNRYFFSDNEFILADGEGLVGHKGLEYGVQYADRETITPTYRLDKILAKLPEWVLTGYQLGQYSLRSDTVIDEKVFQTIRRADKLYAELVKIRGQAAANAAASLLHLLFKEGFVK